MWQWKVAGDISCIEFELLEASFVGLFIAGVVSCVDTSLCMFSRRSRFPVDFVLQLVHLIARSR